MTRLHSQLQRLYQLPHGTHATALATPDGLTRTLVLSLARPADWDVLATVWRGVQADLSLPAPAIAVSGLDAFQLWFSLADPVSLADGHAFVEALRARYLPDVADKRLRLYPSASGEHAGAVPAELPQSGNWSAFVAPDLAPVFTDSPWLDIPPSPEGQADLLTPLRSITAEGLAEARAVLSRRAATPGPSAAPVAPSPSAQAVPSALPFTDPRQFLLHVMNDVSVPLPLRIDAAKALLDAAAPAR